MEDAADPVDRSAVIEQFLPLARWAEGWRASSGIAPLRLQLARNAKAYVQREFTPRPRSASWKPSTRRSRPA